MKTTVDRESKRVEQRKVDLFGFNQFQQSFFRLLWQCLDGKTAVSDLEVLQDVVGRGAGNDFRNRAPYA